MTQNMNTPWGRSDYVEEVAPGIRSVETPSHGGYWLSAERRAQMPAALSLDSPWYEEDCEWARVAVAFKDLPCFAKSYTLALETLLNWNPDAYEAHLGVTVQPGQSLMRDKALFHEAHKDDLQTIAAFGDWDERCPAGMVLVCARVGGRGADHQWARPDLPERYFLVPDEQYKQRKGPGGFLVDLLQHREVDEQGGFIYTDQDRHDYEMACLLS